MNFRGLRSIRRRKIARNEAEGGHFRLKLNWAGRFHTASVIFAPSGLPRSESAHRRIAVPPASRPRALGEEVGVFNTPSRGSIPCPCPRSRFRLFLEQARGCATQRNAT